MTKKGFESGIRPFVQLSGEDGNAFFIIGRATGAARKAGVPATEIDAFCDDAMAGNYDHVLQTVMAYFETA